MRPLLKQSGTQELSQMLSSVNLPVLGGVYISPKEYEGSAYIPFIVPIQQHCFCCLFLLQCCFSPYWLLPSSWFNHMGFPAKRNRKITSRREKEEKKYPSAEGKKPTFLKSTTCFKPNYSSGVFLNGNWSYTTAKTYFWSELQHWFLTQPGFLPPFLCKGYPTQSGITGWCCNNTESVIWRPATQLNKHIWMRG